MHPNRWLNLFAVELLFVVVIVLIWYMVITPILPHVPLLLELPVSRAGVKSPDREADFMVTILSDGRVLLNGRPTTAVELRRKLEISGFDATLRLRVDRATRFGDVRAVVRVAREAGWRQVTFVVKPSIQQP